MALWLDGRDVGAEVDGEPFNWEGFAYSVATRAREEHSLPLASMSLHVYEELAKRIPTHPTNTFWLSAMVLRTWMISECGAREGDPVLDPETVLRWVQRAIRLSIDEVRRLSAVDLRSLSLDQLFAFRDIKNALHVLSNIAEIPRVRDDAMLQAWLKMRGHVP